LGSHGCIAFHQVEGFHIPPNPDTPALSLLHNIFYATLAFGAARQRLQLGGWLGMMLAASG
jgi:hypothetical protein